MPAAALLAALLCQAAPPRVAVAVETRTESLRYRFENPSTFDTAELVPHSFEQTYDTDNVWIRATVRHAILTAPAEFSASGTPAATRRADDFDTFHQPSGDIVVAGTTGNATLQSWTVSEGVTTARWRALGTGVRYEYRRDRWRFHDGDGVVIHSQPPSVAHRVVTTSETTISQIHALSWVADVHTSPGPRGSFLLRFTTAPFAVARLTVKLPDKYPGRDLDFSANVALMDIEMRYRHALGRWSLGAGARGQRSFNWQARGQMHLSGASLFVEAGRR
jgi:hypothetical protein